MVTVLIFKLFSNFLLVWHSLRYRTPIPPWTYYISMQVEQVLCLVASICAPRAPLHPSTLYLGSPTCALHQFEPHMPSSYLGVPLMAALEKKISEGRGQGDQVLMPLFPALWSHLELAVSQRYTASFRAANLARISLFPASVNLSLPLCLQATPGLVYYSRRLPHIHVFINSLFVKHIP